MSRGGRCFLSYLLVFGVLVFVIANATDGMIHFPVADQYSEEEEHYEPAAVGFDTDLVELAPEFIDQINARLEEEQAALNLGISVNDDQQCGVGDGFGNVSALAGLSVVSNAHIEEDDAAGDDETEETEERFGYLLPDYYDEEVDVTELDDGNGSDDVRPGDTDDSEEETEAEEEPSAFDLLFEDKLVPNPDMLATECINVRNVATLDGAVVGKLYTDSWAHILEEVKDEEGNSWYHIQSGNVEGWVYGPYCFIGSDAEDYALTNNSGYYRGTVTTERLNVRSAMSTDAPCIGQVTQNNQFRVVSIEDGWVGFDYRGALSYVSLEFVNVEYVMKVAMTLEEEKAWLAEQERIARDNQIAANINAHAARGGMNRQTTYLSYDEMYLFACTIEMETGGCGYDEQMAVANVILNRYYSGIWGWSINSVVHSPGQFTGANTGLLASYMASGPSQQSWQVAYDACAGFNTIGSYMYFCSLGKVGSVNAASGMYVGRVYLYVQGW